MTMLICKSSCTGSFLFCDESSTLFDPVHLDDFGAGVAAPVPKLKLSFYIRPALCSRVSAELKSKVP